MRKRPYVAAALIAWMLSVTAADGNLRHPRSRLSAKRLRGWASILCSFANGLFGRKKRSEAKATAILSSASE
jgi:hypothetical protein